MRPPAWLLVIFGVIVVAIIGLVIWFAVPKGTNTAQTLTPSPSATQQTPDDEPTPTPTPTSTPTPTPAPTAPPSADDGAPGTGQPPAAQPTTPPTNPPVTDTTAPGLVTALTGTASPHGVVLSWTNPSASDYAGAIVRRAAGSAPPSTATDGDAVGTVNASATGITDSGLATATYSYSVFTRDTTGNISAAASATFTLPAALAFGTTDVDGAVYQVEEYAVARNDSGELDFTAFDETGARTATVSNVTASPLGTLTATIAEPSGGNPGTVTWQYTVDNDQIRYLGASATKSETFRITIGDGTDSIQTDVTVVAHGINDVPVWSASTTVPDVPAGQTTQFQIPASWIADPDDEPATYALVGGPAWITVTSGGLLTFTPPITQSGTTPFILAAQDAGGLTAIGGNTAGADSQQIVLTVTPATNSAPVANDDEVTWDLRTGPSQLIVTPLDNDTDDGLGTLAVIPHTDDWYLDSDPSTPAGTWALQADGDLVVTPSTDPFGPLALLNPGEQASATITYTITDGLLTDSGDVNLTIIGTLDPVSVVGPIEGVSDGDEIDADSAPIQLDVRDTFGSPDPFRCDDLFDLTQCTGTVTDYLTYTWHAVVSNGAVLDGSGGLGTWSMPLASFGGDDVSVTLTVTATPKDARAAVSASVTFAIVPHQTFPADAVDDAVDFDLREGDWLDADTASVDLLANDSNAASAVPLTGTWTLEGDDDPAGTYSIAADGTLTLDDGTDDFGPLQRLAPDETAVAHLQYTAVSPDGNDTASITINVTGAADPIYKLGSLNAPAGGLLDIADGGTTTFDATPMFEGPDPGDNFTYAWFMETFSQNPVPPFPALIPGSNLPSLVAPHSSLEIDTYTVTVLIHTDLGRPVVGGDTESVVFTTTNAGGDPVVVANDDTASWDLRSTNQAPFAVNVLTNDLGAALSATATSGDFTLAGDGRAAGTYSLATDGTLTLTPADIVTGTDPDSADYFSPLSLLDPGETAHIQLGYTAANGFGSDTGDVDITVTGRLDPIYQVRPLVAPDNELVDFNGGSTLFDASQVFDSPDPFVCGEPPNCGPDSGNITTQPTSDPRPPGSPTPSLWFQYYWQAQSSVTVPPDPAFIANHSVPWVVVPNTQWGFNSQCSVTITAIPGDGRAALSVTVSFFVTDAGFALMGARAHDELTQLIEPEQPEPTETPVPTPSPEPTTPATDPSPEPTEPVTEPAPEPQPEPAPEPTPTPTPEQLTPPDPESAPSG